MGIPLVKVSYTFGKKPFVFRKNPSKSAKVLCSEIFCALFRMNKVPSNQLTSPSFERHVSWGSHGLDVACMIDLNTPFCYCRRSRNRTTFCFILKDFRMCTIVIEALTPLDRASCIKMYKSNARSWLFEE